MAADESVAMLCARVGVRGAATAGCSPTTSCWCDGVVVEHLFDDGRLAEHEPTPEARLAGDQVVYDVGVAPPLFDLEG